MPPVEQTDMVDKAMMWEFVRTDRKGMPIVSSPEEIVCRWEEGQYEMKDAEGQVLVVDVVMASIQNIKVGSLLWEGSEDDLEELVGTSLIPTDAIYEIVLRNRAKDLKGGVTRYEFGLRRFKDRTITIGS